MSIPRRSSGHLYAVLDVSKDATPEEIKKAYRKKALQLHPDKTGGVTTEEFKAIQEANAVLSEPEQRKLYDTFGRAGMAKLEQYGMGGAAAGAMENPMVIRCLMFLFFLVFFLCLLWVALVVSKIDNHKDWKYAAIFTPIWIFCVFIGFSAPAAIWSGITQKRPENALYGLASIMLIVSLAFWVKVLDGHTEWSTFFIIAFVTLGIFYVGEICTLRPSLLQTVLSMQGHPAAAEGITFTSPIYIQQVVSTVFTMICTLAFFGLMRARLVLDKPDLSFYLIFLPLYIRYSLPLVLSFVWTMKEANATIRERLCALLLLLFSLAASLYTIVMISVKMQKEWNDGVEGPSAAVCAILLFIVFGALTLASTCACCCVGRILEGGDASDYSNLHSAAEEGAAGTGVDESSPESPVANASTPIVAAPSAAAGAGAAPEEPTSHYNSID